MREYCSPKFKQRALPGLLFKVQVRADILKLSGYPLIHKLKVSANTAERPRKVPKDSKALRYVFIPNLCWLYKYKLIHM